VRCGVSLRHRTSPDTAAAQPPDRRGTGQSLDDHLRNHGMLRLNQAGWTLSPAYDLNPVPVDLKARVLTTNIDLDEGPAVDPLEFLARVLVHIPDKGHVTTRYYGWYANRPRGMRGKVATASAVVPPVIVPAPQLAPTEASRRWAALLQQIFEVDPLACPSCHGAMRIVACITQRSVIDQILAHLRTRAATAAHAAARRSSLDPGTVWTGRHATTRRGPSGPLSLTSTPRAHVGGRSARASDPPGRWGDSVRAEHRWFRERRPTRVAADQRGVRGRAAHEGSRR